MRVLVLSNSIGGFVNFRIELLDALIKRGDEVYISSQIENNSNPDAIISRGGRFVELKMKQRGVNPFEEIRLVKAYEKLIKDIKPQIILSYTIKPNIYGGIAARRNNVPIISSVTGLGTAIENGGILQKISIFLYRWGLKKTNFLFFQNQFSMDFFKNKNIFALNQGLVHGSGVNLEKFTFSEYPKEDNGLDFIFISRILPSKGVKEYLEVAQKIKKKYKNIKFHIIGIRDDEFLSNLVEIKHAEGIIIYHGQQNDVRPFIRNSHCIVHPSYYPEGMSNVLQEGAALGRPAITTDKPGCKDVIEENITGYIVKQADINSLYKAVECFINLPFAKKVEMGRAARKRMEIEFDRKKVVNMYINKIDELTV